MGVGQGLSFPLWVEMALPLFYCRRHGGGSELATFILGQTGPPTDRPVRFYTVPACCSGAAGKGPEAPPLN